MTVRTQTFPILIAAGLAIASLQAQKGTIQKLDLETVLERPETLVPKPPRCGFVPGETMFVYQVSEVPGPIEVVERLDVRTRGRAHLFNGPQLRAALKNGGATISPGGSVPPFEFVDGKHVRVRTSDGIWNWEIKAEKAERRLEFFAGASASALATGDGAVAAIVDDDLRIRAADGAVARVTWDGHTEDVEYGGAAHRAEFGIQSGLFWDPQGQRLAFYREDKRPIAAYPYADFTKLPPEPVHGRYPMAGRQHSVVTVGVFDRRDGSLHYLEHEGDPDLYWTNLTFTPDGSRLVVAQVSRNQSQCDLVEFDAATGARLRTLFTETDPLWIEPEVGPTFLPDGTFLWISYRDGWRRVWRHAADGALLWPENEGAFDVRSILAVSKDGSRMWIEGSGADPRENHVFEVRLGRPEPPMLLSARVKQTNLTAWGRGWHDCRAREDGVAIDIWSNLQTSGLVSVLTEGGGRWIVGTAPNPFAGLQMGRQEFFTVQTEDDAVLYGHVILPPYPDVLRKSPILLYVYGGPHVQLVRDQFGGGANPWLHYMASQGYIVVRCDGRGTPSRGREFAQAIHRHLGEIEVFDQLSALDTVARLFPFADRDRVGVHGWSFGGYMTLRLMTLAPQSFVCGVAGAPVTDWRQYETGYTERYMDTPEENPDGYEASSVLPFVENLDGRLLLVQGTDDKTVMWSHAMAFLQRCIASRRLVDFMAYPMELHGLRGDSKKHFLRLMTRFFADHLPAPEQKRPPLAPTGQAGDGLGGPIDADAQEQDDAGAAKKR